MGENAVAARCQERAWSDGIRPSDAALLLDAADEIERLEADVLGYQKAADKVGEHLNQRTAERDAALADAQRWRDMNRDAMALLDDMVRTLRRWRDPVPEPVEVLTSERAMHTEQEIKRALALFALYEKETNRAV